MPLSTHTDGIGKFMWHSGCDCNGAKKNDAKSETHEWETSLSWHHTIIGRNLDNKYDIHAPSDNQNSRDYVVTCHSLKK